MAIQNNGFSHAWNYMFLEILQNEISDFSSIILTCLLQTTNTIVCLSHGVTYLCTFPGLPLIKKLKIP